MSLTYSVVYTPVNKDWELNHPKYTCHDNKIHIRFKDYNSPQIISGFEEKLTYLLSYLLHYNFQPQVLMCKSNEQIMNLFLKDNDVQEINLVIRDFTNDNKYKGLKLLKNYNKKDTVEFFGKTDINCFPVNKDGDGVTKIGSLELFLNNLGKISLVNYLFNDNYKIYIHKLKSEKTNKFERKQLRKIKPIEKIELVDLW